MIQLRRWFLVGITFLSIGAMAAMAAVVILTDHKGAVSTDCPADSLACKPRP